MNKRKICVFTGSRADYGLLKPLILKIKDSNNYDLQIVASGMHLSPEFGLTYQEIEKDGINITKKIEILLSSDSYSAMAKSTGLGIVSFVDVLNELSPDLIIILGDRFEALAFAIACYFLKIPIAHIHGGEITLGSLDDGIRHSITKLSTLHFTSTEIYRKRVIQLGESPERVFNVGALGIENIVNMKLLQKNEVEKIINKKFKDRNLLITYHPTTSDNGDTIKNLNELLKALDELNNTLLIFTKSNADSEGRKINKILENYTQQNSDKTVLFTSMGQLLYLSTMKYVDAVVGNSSSGIIEAPSLKIATINIGDRQKGRVKSSSVIDCLPEYNSIKKALNIIYANEFRQKLKNVVNPYGVGNTSEKIMNVLSNFDFKINQKEFYDLSF